MTRQITPRYKLMLFYDLAAREPEAYYQFVMTEMIPTMHTLGLYIFRAFHTIPGPEGATQPMRQVEFVAEDLETIQQVLGSAKWLEFEDRLLQHATNYHRKIVRFRHGFQL